MPDEDGHRQGLIVVKVVGSWVVVGVRMVGVHRSCWFFDRCWPVLLPLFFSTLPLFFNLFSLPTAKGRLFFDWFFDEDFIRLLLLYF